MYLSSLLSQICSSFVHRETGLFFCLPSQSSWSSSKWDGKNLRIKFKNCHIFSIKYRFSSLQQRNLIKPNHSAAAAIWQTSFQTTPAEESYPRSMMLPRHLPFSAFKILKRKISHFECRRKHSILNKRPFPTNLLRLILLQTAEGLYFLLIYQKNLWGCNETTL